MNGSSVLPRISWILSHWPNYHMTKPKARMRRRLNIYTAICIASKGITSLLFNAISLMLYRKPLHIFFYFWSVIPGFRASIAINTLFSWDSIKPGKDSKSDSTLKIQTKKAIVYKKKKKLWKKIYWDTAGQIWYRWRKFLLALTDMYSFQNPNWKEHLVFYNKSLLQFIFKLAFYHPTQS